MTASAPVRVRHEAIERLADQAVADLRRVRVDLGITDFLDFFAGWWINELKHQPDYFDTDENRNLFERFAMNKVEGLR